MSVIADIAEAVKDELNGPGARRGFSQPFTAERHYRPDFDLVEMQDLHVTVVPKGVEMSAAGRSLAQSDVQIDVAVQKKLTAADPDLVGTEIDGLMTLVEEIADYFRQNRQLASFPDAVWVRTENAPIYAAEHLGELRQFTSVLTLTYRVMK